jgi:hypothetical protein
MATSSIKSCMPVSRYSISGCSLSFKLFFFHHHEALFILCDHISSLCCSGWATTVSMTYHAFITFRCVSYFSTRSFAQRIVNAAVLLFGLQSWMSADVDRIQTETSIWGLRTCKCKQDSSPNIDQFRNFLFSNVFTYMHASDTKFWYRNSVEIFKLPTTCTKLPSTFLTADPKVLFDPHRYVSMTGQWWSVRPTTLPNFYSNRPWPFLLHFQA